VRKKKKKIDETTGQKYRAAINRHINMVLPSFLSVVSSTFLTSFLPKKSSIGYNTNDTLK